MKQCQPRSAGLRQRKQDLLPQITKLADEGLSSREIGAKVGVGKTAIAQWLREMRREAAARQSLDPEEMIGKEIAFYLAVRDEAIDAWRLSRADKQVRVVEQSGRAGEPAPTRRKKSIRTETRSGDSNLLGKAMKAQKAIDGLNQRLAKLQQSDGAGGNSGPNLLADLTDDDLEKLTPDDLENMTDEQLFAIGKRLHVKYGLTEPLLTKEDLHDMTDEQLTALELKLLDEIDRCHETN